MRVEWHGQAAFTLQGGEGTVVIDPFGDVAALRDRGIRWDYPPIDAPSADLVLVTHEHLDHNGVEVVGGEPAILRSQAGRHDSPLGEVVGIASEHDEAAGTERGPNTIFAFTLDDLRVVHFGDFGQAGLRREQRQALGEVDLLFLPVGGGPTIGGEVRRRSPASSSPSGSCRCTTGPSGSVSSRAPTSSSPRWAGHCASRGRPSRRQSCHGTGGRSP